MRVSAIETALKANWSAGALANVAIAASGLMSDLHGSAYYRANLIKVLAQRADSLRLSPEQRQRSFLRFRSSGCETQLSRTTRGSNDLEDSKDR